MKTKKMTALLLCGMLAASLAGCQSGGGNSSSGSSTPAPSSSAPSSQSTPSSQGGTEGHVITVLGKDRRYDCAPFSDRDSYPVWQEVEKLLAEAGVTCEFELVPKEQYATVIKTRMAAASDLPDVVGLTDLTDQEVLDMGNQGSLIDIKAAIDQYSDGSTLAMWDKYWPNATKQLTTPEGKIFWYPSLSYKLLNGEPTRGTGTAIQYRKDWLDTLKLDVPSTTEELYNVLKAFRDNDVNGSGAPDEIALCSVDSFNNGLAQCYGLAPRLFDIEAATDKAVTPWTQPGIKPYLEYMKKLVAEGIIDASLIGASGEVGDQKVTENKAGLCYTYVQQNWLEEMTGAEEADYVPFLPTGVEGINPVFRRESPTLVYQRFGVTKNCKDVEGAVALFDALYSDEYAELSFWGVEGVSFKMDGGRRVSIHPDYSDEQLAEAKELVGHSICGNVVFPVVNIQEEWSDTLTASGVSQAKQDFEASMQTYDYEFGMSQPLAMPTDEERAVVDQYITTLETYSQELLVNIILGNKPIEELDAAVEEMKGMGLDEVLAAYQSRHDRYTAS